MNTPIINPLWIYFADVLPKIGGTFISIGVVGFIITAFLTLIVSINEGWEDDEEFVCLKTIIKKYFYVPIILLVIGMFIPGQSTIYGMITSNYITPANIESVGNNAKDIVDYIFEKINEKEDKEQK